MNLVSLDGSRNPLLPAQILGQTQVFRVPAVQERVWSSRDPKSKCLGSHQ